MKSMFGKSKKQKTADLPEFDRVNMKAVIRCSICTGEQVAGFKDIHTGKFTEVMLIKGDKDLQYFRQVYGLKPEEIGREY